MERRRKEDNMNIIQKYASTVTAIAVLLGALVLIGSTVFARVDDVKKLEVRVIDVEKCQIRTETIMKTIHDDIKEIKKAVKR